MQASGGKGGSSQERQFRGLPLTGQPPWRSLAPQGVAQNQTFEQKVKLERMKQVGWWTEMGCSWGVDTVRWTLSWSGWGPHRPDGDLAPFPADPLALEPHEWKPDVSVPCGFSPASVWTPASAPDGGAGAAPPQAWRLPVTPQTHSPGPSLGCTDCLGL